MKWLLFLVFFTFLSSSFSQNNYLYEDLKFISHDSLQGRLVGSTNETKCAQYLCNTFEKMGLAPLFSNGYLQHFEASFSKNPHNPILSKKIKIKSKNVCAYLDNNANKTIVIGAHYDHLGYNEYGQSLNNSKTKHIHNGADDNASGVAGVLEMARTFSSNNVVENANFIFVLFSGEEIGLVGSKIFADSIIKSTTIHLMINMDMIGRMDSMERLYIGGVGTSDIFHPILIKEKPENFKLEIDSSGIGPSDHTSFYNHNVPVLFFHTGTHEDYHKPTDDLEKINLIKLNEIIKYIESIILNVSNIDTIHFQPTKSNHKSNTSVFKVTLGIMPNYAFFEDGLHIENVIEDRPAFKAGLIRGDVITYLDNCKIIDIYSYMECLSKYKKGDKIKVKILRNGTEIIKKVTA